MVTTSRLIVVLASELGEQLKLAHDEYRSISDNISLPMGRKIKQLNASNCKIKRIRLAQEAIARLTLGDIEDNEHKL